MDTFIVVASIGAIFWGLTMLVIIDVILKDFGSIQTKALWGFVALIPVLGWIVYLIFGYKKGIRKKSDSISNID